jgi:hypothetical protein
MAVINLASVIRPNTASIFASDPVTKGKVVAFILKNVAIPVPGRVRLDLTQAVSVNRRVTLARSPVERVVVDNIRTEPRTISVTGSLSATPLGAIGVVMGSFGALIRRDLRETKKLRMFLESGEPVILVTPSEVHESVAITSLQETHSGDNKVELSMTFDEVRIVSPLTIAGVFDLDVILAGSNSTTALGSQPTTEFEIPAAYD